MGDKIGENLMSMIGMQQDPNNPSPLQMPSGRELLFRTIASSLPPPGQLRVPGTAGGRILGTGARLIGGFSDTVADELARQRLDPLTRQLRLIQQGVTAAQDIQVPDQPAQTIPTIPPPVPPQQDLSITGGTPARPNVGLFGPQEQRPSITTSPATTRAPRSLNEALRTATPAQGRAILAAMAVGKVPESAFVQDPRQGLEINKLLAEITGTQILGRTRLSKEQREQDELEQKQQAIGRLTKVFQERAQTGQIPQAQAEAAIAQAQLGKMDGIIGLLGASIDPSLLASAQAGRNFDANQLKNISTLPRQERDLLFDIQRGSLPAKVAVSAAQGREAALVKAQTEEQIRRSRPLPNDVQGIIGTGRMTVGEAEDRGISVPDEKDRKELRDARTFTQRTVELVNGIQETIKTNPTVVGISGIPGSSIGALTAQTRNFARLAGIDLEVNLDPKAYEKTFRGLGITRGAMKAQMIGLAFAAAVSTGQSGRSISDRDVELNLQRLGGNLQDPAAVNAVLDNFKKEVHNNYMRRVQSVTGATPQGPLLPPLPPFSGASEADDARVPIVTPDGQQGTVPKSKLEEALRRGAKRVY